MNHRDKQPNIVNHVPWCSREGCQQYDGKRCRLIGFQPATICEPAVIDMAEELIRLRNAVNA